MEKEMECSICKNDFDKTDVLPRKLPCSHSLCSGCLTRVLDNSDNPRCAICRRGIQSTLKSCEEFPVDLNLLEEIDKKSQAPLPLCMIHYKPKDHVCMTDKTRICGECAHGENHKDHKIKSFAEIQADRNEQIAKHKSVIGNFEQNYKTKHRMIKESEIKAKNNIKAKFQKWRDVLQRLEDQEWAECGLLFNQKKLKVEERSNKVWTLKSENETKLSELYAFKPEDENLFKIPDFSDPHPLPRIEEFDTMEFDLDITHEVFDMKSIYQFSFLEDMMNKTNTQPSYESKYEEIQKFLEFEKQGERLIIFPKQFCEKSNEKKINLKQEKKVTVNFKKDRMTEEALQALCYIWNEFEQLEDLYIEIPNASITNQEFETLFEHAFWASSKLKVFEMNLHSTKITDDLLTYFLGDVMSKMPNLASLNLQISQTQITNKSLIAFANKTIPYLNCLESFGLDLYECAGVTDEGVSKVFEAVDNRFRNVKKLVLNFGSTGITDRSLEMFGERVGLHMTCLKDLHLCLSKIAISDDGVARFCASFKNTIAQIKEFTLLLNNTQITDVTVQGFANNFVPNMTGVDKFTFSCYGTAAQDGSIAQLFKGLKRIIQQLNTLVLNLGKSKVSDKSMTLLPDEILKDVSKLEQFKVYLHSTEVTDKSVKKLCSKLPKSLTNLNTFALGLCNTPVTDNGAKGIIKYLTKAKNLKSFQVYLENTKVTEDQMYWLQTIQR